LCRHRRLRNGGGHRCPCPARSSAIAAAAVARGVDAPEVNVAQRALASPRRSRGRGSRRGGAIGVYGTYLERQSLGARALRSRAARRTRRDSAGRAVHGARARQRVAYAARTRRARTRRVVEVRARAPR